MGHEIFSINLILVPKSPEGYFSPRVQNLYRTKVANVLPVPSTSCVGLKRPEVPIGALKGGSVQGCWLLVPQLQGSKRCSLTNWTRCKWPRMVEFPFHPNQGSVLKLDARKEFFLEKIEV